MHKELGALRDELHAQRTDVSRDGKRRRAADERLQTEALAAVETSGRQLAAVQRALAELQEQRQRDVERLGAAEEVARRACAAADAATAQITEQLSGVRRALGERRKGGGQVTAQLVAVEALARTAEQAAQAISRDLGAELAALAGRLDRDVTDLGRRIAAQEEERARDAEQVASADQVVLALHAEIDAAMARTGDEVAALRARHDALAAQIGDRLADLPAIADEGAQARLGEHVAELTTATARLDAEQRRLAADVDERLRALMRTAAGGFDVQLALLRGKVELMAQALRERGPGDPAGPFAESTLEHRISLLQRLREQLTALQSGAEWHPQRVLDLLMESTLTAATAPLRKILHLADAEPASDQDPATAALTDESGEPSSDP
jgi:chromosome segregation ATPase